MAGPCGACIVAGMLDLGLHRAIDAGYVVHHYVTFALPHILRVTHECTSALFPNPTNAGHYGSRVSNSRLGMVGLLYMVHVAEGTEPGGFLFDLWGLVVAGWKRIEQLSKRSQTESRSDETFEMSARNTIGGFRRWLPFKVSNLGICDGFTLFPPEFHALHATDRWQDGRRERSSSRR